MASKSKQTKRSLKRRLALPASWVKNIEDAGKNIRAYRGKGVKEVEKIYSKVIEIDFVKKARKNDVVRKATEASTRIGKEVEGRVKQLRKEVEVFARNARKALPVPSRNEIEELTHKIAELSKKIDEISTKKAEIGSSAVKRSVSSI